MMAHTKRVCGPHTLHTITLIEPEKRIQLNATSIFFYGGRIKTTVLQGHFLVLAGFFLFSSPFSFPVAVYLCNICMYGVVYVCVKNVWFSSGDV